MLYVFSVLYTERLYSNDSIVCLPTGDWNVVLIKVTQTFTINHNTCVVTAQQKLEKVGRVENENLRSLFLVSIWKKY